MDQRTLASRQCLQEECDVEDDTIAPLAIQIEFTPEGRAKNAGDILVNTSREGNDVPDTTADNISTNSRQAHSIPLHTSTINVTILSKTSSRHERAVARLNGHAISCSMLPSPLERHRDIAPDPYPHQCRHQFSQILGTKYGSTPMRGEHDVHNHCHSPGARIEHPKPR